MKFAQAERAVEACAAVWVEYGVSIRDATLGEAIALRNRQAAWRERLPYAELPGVVYEPSLSAANGFRRECEVAAWANLFALKAVAEGPQC